MGLQCVYSQCGHNFTMSIIVSCEFGGAYREKAARKRCSLMIASDIVDTLTNIDSCLHPNLSFCVSQCKSIGCQFATLVVANVKGIYFVQRNAVPVSFN